MRAVAADLLALWLVATVVCAGVLGVVVGVQHTVAHVRGHVGPRSSPTGRSHAPPGSAPTR